MTSVQNLMRSTLPFYSNFSLFNISLLKYNWTDRDNGCSVPFIIPIFNKTFVLRGTLKFIRNRNKQRKLLINSNKSNGLIHFISFKILKKYPKWTFYYTIRKCLYFNYVGLLQMNLRKLLSFHGPFAFFFFKFSPDLSLACVRSRIWFVKYISRGPRSLGNFIQLLFSQKNRTKQLSLTVVRCYPEKV